MTLWSLISQTDAISKFILLLLLALSFTCWTLALYKLNILKLKAKQLKQAQPLLFHINNIEDIVARASTLQNSFAGQLLAHYLTELKRAFKQSTLKLTNQTNSQISEKRLTQSDFEKFNKNIEQTAINALEAEELSIPLFSTIAQIAPLLGLFGTVWGLIHAFMSISEQQQVDIATIAPGIAEALFTTLAGLIVAIPAIVLFNLLVNKVRIFEQQLINLTLCFMDAIQSFTILNVTVNSGNNNQFAVDNDTTNTKRIIPGLTAQAKENANSPYNNNAGLETSSHEDINEI